MLVSTVIVIYTGYAKHRYATGQNYDKMTQGEKRGKVP